MVAGLRAAKDNGLPFDEAWDAVWSTVKWPHDTVHRRQWRAALRSQKPEIEASYRDLPTRTSALLRDLSLDLLIGNDTEEVLDAARAIAA